MHTQLEGIPSAINIGASCCLLERIAFGWRWPGSSTRSRCYQIEAGQAGSAGVVRLVGAGWVRRRGACEENPILYQRYRAVPSLFTAVHRCEILRWHCRQRGSGTPRRAPVATAHRVTGACCARLPSTGPRCSAPSGFGTITETPPGAGSPAGPGCTISPAAARGPARGRPRRPKASAATAAYRSGTARTGTRWSRRESETTPRQRARLPGRRERPGKRHRPRPPRKHPPAQRTPMLRPCPA